MSVIIDASYLPQEKKREPETHQLELGGARIRVRLLPTAGRVRSRVVIELSFLSPSGEVLEHCFIDAHSDAEARALMPAAAAAFASSARVRQRARATDSDKC
jgi:hypothetical protein